MVVSPYLVMDERRGEAHGNGQSHLPVVHAQVLQDSHLTVVNHLLLTWWHVIEAVQKV